MGRRWAFMTPPQHLGFFNGASIGRLLEGRLGLRIVASASTGKWVNVGFLLYKLGRVFPSVGPVASRVQRSPLARAVVYVPTADIQYVTARKPEVA
jgi:hypothetical protein